MYVNGMGPAKGPRGPEGSSGARPVEGSDKSGQRDVAAPGRDRADKVEISAQGRAMAEAAQSGLAPEQVSWYRGRLDAGYYDSPEVVSETARRILHSGDL